MFRRTLAALAIGALVLAACGGDDDAGGDEQREAYIEAMAASMAAGEDLSFAPEDRDCLAGELVDAIGGPDALQEAGVTPEQLAGGQDLTALGLDLGEEEAQAMAASFGNCDVSLADLLLADAGDQVSQETRDCVEENLDEAVLAEFFARVLVDEGAGDEPPEAVLEPLTACF